MQIGFPITNLKISTCQESSRKPVNVWKNTEAKYCQSCKICLIDNNPSDWQSLCNWLTIISTCTTIEWLPFFLQKAFYPQKIWAFISRQPPLAKNLCRILDQNAKSHLNMSIFYQENAFDLVKFLFEHLVQHICMLELMPDVLRFNDLHSNVSAHQMFPSPMSKHHNWSTVHLSIIIPAFSTYMTSLHCVKEMLIFALASATYCHQFFHIIKCIIKLMMHFTFATQLFES